MTALSFIPREWAEEAVAIARRQHVLPDSPGKFIGGQYKLCAAACIAYAGLKKIYPGHEEAFLSALCRKNHKHLVTEAFGRLRYHPL